MLFTTVEADVLVPGTRPPLEASPETVLADVGHEFVELASEPLSHPGGPLAGEPSAPPFA